MASRRIWPRRDMDRPIGVIAGLPPVKAVNPEGRERSRTDDSSPPPRAVGPSCTCGAHPPSRRQRLPQLLPTAKASYAIAMGAGTTVASLGAGTSAIKSEGPRAQIPRRPEPTSTSLLPCPCDAASTVSPVVVVVVDLQPSFVVPLRCQSTLPPISPHLSTTLMLVFAKILDTELSFMCFLLLMLLRSSVLCGNLLECPVCSSVGILICNFQI